MKTGQKVKVSGEYRCSRCSHAATFVKGKKLPPCSSCGKATSWRPPNILEKVERLFS